MDSIVMILNPIAGLRRHAARFAYDAVKSHRLNTKRSGLGGTADSQLDVFTLDGLREICRELCRNNALISGLLKTERDGIVGDGVDIQARTSDDSEDGWNHTAERLWKEDMIDHPCDATGRFNFNEYLQKMYLAYRRDGDMFTIFTKIGLQAIEGEQCGTPFTKVNKESKNLKIINGIAYSKNTGQVIGYYIGEPDDTGCYIKPESFQTFTADKVHHHFNPARFSQSRGEPVLAPSIKYIDYLAGYIDAELVAAKVNACFSAFVTKKDAISGFPLSNVGGTGGTGVTDGKGNLARREKIEPGIIEYLQPGEGVEGVGMTHPGTMFDPFVLRMLTLIGRPLCIPLMLITLDFSGATFMNARIAYQKVQEAWMIEQNVLLKQFASRVWRWKIDQWIAAGLLKDREDKYKHEIKCNRWPYVDPYKEAVADEQQLKNGTTTRTKITSRQGDDFKDLMDEREKEEKIITDKKLNLDPDKKGEIKNAAA